MRRVTSLALAPAAIAVAATALFGQEQPVPPTAAPGYPAPGGAVQATQTQPGRAIPPQIRAEIAILRATRLAGRIPPADSFMVGGRRVAAGETVGGTIAVTRGPIDVYGRIEGDAIALHGDVTIHEGGRVRGDAISIGGRVRARGGVVEGDLRSVSGILPLSTDAGRGRAGAAPTTWQSIKVVLGWFAILLMIGIGVLVFAESTFDPVVESLQQRFGRAFWYGLAAQVAAIPLLLLIVLALALTVVGILLVPFAIVTYAVALAGALTLGFLAVARFTGGALTGRGRTDAPKRGASLRALVVGLTIYLGLWLAAATFSWSPLAGSVLRAVALAVTWVAVTLGLGALVASRVALRRGAAPATAGVPDPMVWQTPTPVTGVAAARRPVSAARPDLN